MISKLFFIKKGGIFLLFFYFLFVSCIQKNAKINHIEFITSKTDSIILKGFYNINELLNIYQYSNEMIYTFDNINGVFRFYTLVEKNKKIFEHTKTIQPIKKSDFYSYINSIGDNIYFINYDGYVFNYNINKNTVSCTDSFFVPNKKDSYFYFGENISPIYYKPNQYFISKLTYKDPIDRPAYLKELLFNFVYSNNKNCVSILKNPLDVEKYYPNLSLHTIDTEKNVIVNLFPCNNYVDVIDLNSKLTHKVNLQNQDYENPESFDTKKAFVEYDTKYSTLHRLKGFYYNAIYYNFKTKQYYIFYKKPVNAKKPIEADMEFYYIITDNNLKTLSYHKLGKNFQMAPYKLEFNNNIYLPKFKILYDEKNPLVLYNITK